MGPKPVLTTCTVTEPLAKRGHQGKQGCVNVKVAIGNGCYDPEGRVLGKLGPGQTVQDSWVPGQLGPGQQGPTYYNISINIFKNVLSDIDIFKNGGII